MNSKSYDDFTREDLIDEINDAWECADEWKKQAEAAEKAAPDSGLKTELEGLAVMFETWEKNVEPYEPEVDTNAVGKSIRAIIDRYFQPPTPAGPEDSVFQRTGEMIAQQLRTAPPESARRWLSVGHDMTGEATGKCPTCGGPVARLAKEE